MSRKARVDTLAAEAQTLAEIQLRLQRQKKPEAPSHDVEYWSPQLSTEQQLIFDSKARFILADGERFSGKTYGILHKLVRHAWENHNAHVLIVVGVRRQSTAGGGWEKLVRDILPDWKENVEGLDYGEPRLTAEKDMVLEMKNQYGTRSLFHLISIPHGGNLAARIRGIEVTAIFVDELVGIGGMEYFSELVQQIGRRVDVPIENQFYAAATNPGGPSHWVYKLFVGQGTNDDGTPFRGGRVRPDGTSDDRFLRVHVPISSNPDPRAQQYYRDFVLPAVSNDPIEYKRMVEGVWVDRPSGDALFAGYFVPDYHVRGDAKEGTILRPTPKRSITLGYDLGDVNSCVSFLQERFTKEKTLWTGLDEIAYTDKCVAYARLVPEVLDRMNWWCEQEQNAFRFEHISDRSAFDRYRATSGAYDYQMVERISREMLKKFPSRWPWLKEPIRLKECPKPPGSVAARIKVCREAFQNETLFLSGPKMPKTVQAFLFLESKKDKPMEPLRSPHLHPYDALSYVLYYHELGAMPALHAPEAEQLTPQVSQIGGSVSA